jgi:hypothetical protein
VCGGDADAFEHVIARWPAHPAVTLLVSSIAVEGFADRVRAVAHMPVVDIDETISCRRTARSCWTAARSW